MPLLSPRLALALAALLSVLVALSTYRFVFLGLGPAFPPMAGHIDGARLAFLAHVGAAPVALALGAFQFMPRRRGRLHRWTGRVYALAILVAGGGALAMLPTGNGGVVAQAGFGLLAVLWIGFTLNGVRLAMASRFAEHQVWMIRSFALTFAAVTLRLYLAPMLLAGMDYPDAIRILAWVCWVPNLALVEAALRRAGPARRRA